ncbi:hypothetical protein PHYBOEH_006000 [Phytophthora boehmeriae]|uniref:M96 mating-specific protein family n=1 Tax=Phytophthora boehmeriae TaxID=109152 RepID=A0A8T1WIT2_9STRA|nr:hypothetical protein PHYBOEH_006000 [Phytophthora boehmeriae]
MQSDNVDEQLDASTPPLLLDDSGLFMEFPNLLHATDSFYYPVSPCTASPDVSSPSYSPSNFPRPSNLTPEEATELLQVLDASTAFQTPPTQEQESQDAVAQVSLAKSPLQRRKPGRKKSKSPSTGKMRNPSRERLQSELAYLRRKTVELEDQLRGLHLSRRANLSFMTRRSLESQETAGTGARVWRRIAERQARGRDLSERENKRLKSVLEGQIALAKKLEQLLQKRPDVTVMRESSGVPHKRLGLGQMEDPTSMYKLFLSELDVLYAQMDSVFHQTGLETSVDDSFRHAYVKTRRGAEGEEELYAELQDVTIIPFELERASSAMWHAVRRQYNKNSYHSFQGAMERPDDTIAVKYRSQCQRSGQDIELDAIMVMCRYVERDRLAFVWRSVSCGDGEFSGMYTDETGWSVLKRIPPDSGLDLTGCVMHNCVHVIPKRVDVASDPQRNEIGLLTNVVIDSYEDDVISLSTMMEDLLLQDSIDSPSVTIHTV